VDHLDVVIVGAGPAGAWAAYRLASAGARVAIFDASHPREKPCGGGETGRALALVGEAVLRDVPAVAIEEAVFEDAAGAARVRLGGHGATPGRALAVMARRAFDGALLEAACEAGAALVRARALDATPGRSPAVRTAAGLHRAGIVLGADGANSLVRRRVAAPFARAQLSVAAGFFVRGASSSGIVVRFETSPAGYLWSFPRPDHVAVGVCAQGDEAQAAALRAGAAAWIARQPWAAGAPLEPYAWPIPSLAPRDLDVERPAGPGWLLLGDAAGLVDPITREGLFFALESSEAAAAAILEDRDPTLGYAARVRDGIHPELRRAGRLKRAFFHPRFTRLLIEALNESAPIRSVMADLVSGRQTYAGLKRRLLGTLELGLVWRMLTMNRNEERGMRNEY
jgi:geranylgeranyl reductase family protein